MANFYRTFLKTVLVLSILVYINGEPTRCYYCNTDADGEACNSPLNISAVRIQYCSNSTIADNGVPLPKDTNGVASVCATMTYTSRAGQFVTIRECQSEELMNREACSYLKQAVLDAGISDFTCSLCDSDLCNYNASSSLYISFVVLIFSVFLKVLL